MIRVDTRSLHTRHTDAVPTPEPTIVCVDCGGRCHLLTPSPEDGMWEAGEIVAYRCEDCRDRWDLVLPDWDADDD
jgi:hypothetical protein